MCLALQYGIFLFFAAWVIVMTLFVMMVVPETKNIPLVRRALSTPERLGSPARLFP